MNSYSGIINKELVDLKEIKISYRYNFFNVILTKPIIPNYLRYKKLKLFIIHLDLPAQIIN